MNQHNKKKYARQTTSQFCGFIQNNLTQIHLMKSLPWVVEVWPPSLHSNSKARKNLRVYQVFFLFPKMPDIRDKCSPRVIESIYAAAAAASKKKRVIPASTFWWQPPQNTHMNVDTKIFRAHCTNKNNNSAGREKKSEKVHAFASLYARVCAIKFLQYISPFCAHTRSSPSKMILKAISRVIKKKSRLTFVSANLHRLAAMRDIRYARKVIWGNFSLYVRAAPTLYHDCPSISFFLLLYIWDFVHHAEKFTNNNKKNMNYREASKWQ